MRSIILGTAAAIALITGFGNQAHALRGMVVQSRITPWCYLFQIQGDSGQWFGLNMIGFGNRDM
jgi:hypothetical protein